MIAKEKNRKIIMGIYLEIYDNESILEEWVKSNDKLNEALTLHAKLKNETWSAFSDGGELEYIKDPDLLDEMSKAYFNVNSIKKLSEQYYYHRSARNPDLVRWAEINLLRILEERIENALSFFSSTVPYWGARTIKKD